MDYKWTRNLLIQKVIMVKAHSRLVMPGKRLVDLAPGDMFRHQKTDYALADKNSMVVRDTFKELLPVMEIENGKLTFLPASDKVDLYSYGSK